MTFNDFLIADNIITFQCIYDASSVLDKHFKSYAILPLGLRLRVKKS